MNHHDADNALSATHHDAAQIKTAPHPSTVYLGGIFFILFFVAIHTASEIVIPFILALVLKLVFQPVLRVLERLHLPRILASGLIIATLVSIVIGFGAALSEPAADWAAKLPASYPQMQEKLSFLRKPLEKTQKFLVQAEKITDSSTAKTKAVAVEGPHLSDKILMGTQSLASSIFVTLLILLFMLIAGDTFLRRLVEVLPRFSDKRQAVSIAHQIEHDLSRYLFTISAMNVCVGIATGIVMFLFQVDNPVLWGLLAFFLNYIPIVGPMIAMCVFFLVSLLSTDQSWTAFLPVGGYLMIHIAEGTMITPMLLAKRFTLNPVLVILSLIFWSWMWGIPGAILAMPMLAITKIICDRIDKLAPLGHFLAG